jgi:hypothetical protein
MLQQATQNSRLVLTYAQGLSKSACQESPALRVHKLLAPKGTPCLQPVEPRILGTLGAVLAAITVAYDETALASRFDQHYGTLCHICSFYTSDEGMRKCCSLNDCNCYDNRQRKTEVMPYHTTQSQGTLERNWTLCNATKSM